MVWNLFVCATFLLGWASSWAPDSSFCWDAKMESHSCSLTIPSRRFAYSVFQKSSQALCFLLHSHILQVFMSVLHHKKLVHQVISFVANLDILPWKLETTTFWVLMSSHYLPVCTFWARFCHCPPIPSIAKIISVSLISASKALDGLDCFTDCLKTEGIVSFIQMKMTTNFNPLWKHKSRKSSSQIFHQLWFAM